jgi:fibronectin-binding autotransporter adhesin
LEIGHNSALGTGTITFRAANSTFRSTDATDRTLSNAIGQFTGADGTTYTFGSLGTGNLTFSGTGSTSLTASGSPARVFNVLNTTTSFAQSFTGASPVTKTGTGTLIFAGNNTYTGNTIINAGTLQIGNGGTTGALSTSSNITVNGTLAFNRSNDVVQGTDFKSSVVISGTGSLVQMGTGNLTLNVANNYSGGTTLNTGTLVIGHAGAAGSGTITQANATSLLKFDTVGTITNAMLVHNVLATQSATLSGAITVNNATWDIDTGDTLTISGNISGPGGLTKNGSGTLVLSGSNSYSAPTVINAGTLNATTANALGSNNTVQINGGTLLVGANGALNNMTVTLNGTSTQVATLSFNSNYSGRIQKLTLSSNSIIDLGPANNIALEFADMAMGFYNLSIYNWSGTTQWGTTYGSGTDTIFFGGGNYTASNIKFYSGAVNSDSFVGSGFEVMPQTTLEGGFTGHYILPVPEPETWATAVILLVGGMVWFLKRARHPLKKKAVPIPHGSLNETE